MQGGSGWARRASTPALGLLLALLIWRDVNFLPVDSLDPSWQSALHMAAHRHMSFDGLVFTYGPLGFLAQGVGHYAWTVVLSALYIFGMGTALGAALVSALRRSVPLPVAALAGFLLMSASRDLGVTDIVVVAVVVAAFGLLRGDHAARTERILVVAGGVMAGTHLLVKFNAGVTVLIVGAITAWFVGARTWRSEATFLGATLGALLAGWLLTANSIGDLFGFFGRSMQVASGYSEAMGIEAKGRGGFYPVAAGVAVIVVALAWTGSRRWSLDRRLGLALAGLMWFYAAFKLGFVRHDGHDIAFFGEVLIVGSVLAASVAGSVTRYWKALPAVGAVGLMIALLVAAKLDVGSLVNPFPALGRAGADLPILTSKAKIDRALAKGRTNLRDRYYHLSPTILNALRGHTVHVRPWEAGVAWAYPEVRWRPLPVFQEYTAYTAALDHLNADFLSGPRAPERILAEERTVDNRNPDWESPATVVAIACHYREVAAETHWQVLARVENRCGPERTLGVVHVQLTDIVPVPTTTDPNMLVVARITGLDQSIFYGLRSTLWRAPEVHVLLSGKRNYRLVPGTAPDGLIVRAPSARLGFSQPFAIESATFLRVDQADGFGLTSHLTIEFVAIPVLR